LTDKRNAVVRELMREDFIAVSPEDSLLDAERILRLARIRHLPVVRNGLLIGVLSHRDVMEASLSHVEDRPEEERVEYLRGVAVERVMRTEPRTVEPQCPLREAAIQMLRYKIGCLPVAEKDPGGLRIVGLITESDLLRAAYAPEFVGVSD
jgi:CBS domain-containing membrane protein